MERYKDEGYLSYTERASKALNDGEISYQDWAKALLNHVPYGDETLRRCSLFFNQFLDRMNDEELNNTLDGDKLQDIKIAKAELARERQKLFDEKRELAETYRWQSRNELYNEKIIAAINRLAPIHVPDINIENRNEIGTTALIAMSDFHAGSTFEVKGLYGEIVNKYDFDIMVARMWKLLRDFTEETDMVYDDITVAILGDAFENVLRMSSLSKLKEPVIDTVIKFSYILAEWIASLQEKTEVPIKVIAVGGNHDIQRLLGSKPSFEDENLMKIVVEFLKLRLKDFKHITIADYTDVAVENIRGTSVAFQHGEDKDLKNTIEYFSNLYNVDIDEIIAGHLHRPESKTIGITDLGDRVLTRVGSIVGTDTFAKHIRVSARPSAYVAMYTDDGKTWNRNYYL